MLTAKPLNAFRLGSQKVVVCELTELSPGQFIDREFSFYARGRRAGRIRIKGFSTASDFQKGIYDFSYTGDEIRPEHLGVGSLIVDSTGSSDGKTLEGLVLSELAELV